VCTSTIQGNGADALEETLGRLNKKSGVKATIVLDRTTGAILKTSGQVSAIRTSKNPGSSSALPTQTAGSFATESNPQGSESQAVEELAGMVWNFVKNAGDLIHDLDTEVRVERDHK
jgi:dynein light chain roadblock-type